MPSQLRLPAVGMVLLAEIGQHLADLLAGRSADALRISGAERPRIGQLRVAAILGRGRCPVRVVLYRDRRAALVRGPGLALMRPGVLGHVLRGLLGVCPCVLAGFEADPVGIAHR